MTSLRTHAAAALVGTALLATPALAQQANTVAGTPPALTGLYLTTDFPAISQAIGDDIALDIHLENRALPPQNIKLGVGNLPAGWGWEFTGEGARVMAATVRPDSNMNLKLALTPPKDVKPGDYAFRVTGETEGKTFEIPVTLTLAPTAAAKVTMEPKLPALRGTAKSDFDFNLTATNDSKEDQVFNLLAQVPTGFEAVFKEQYGSNELTSIPLKAGEKKEIKLTVKAPERAEAGQYPVKAAIASPKASNAVDLMMDITGRPDLSLAAKDGRLSGDAVAGRERTFTYTVQNTGTAPLNAVTLSANPPTGWKVTFAPEKIDGLKAGDTAEVAVTMTPADKAIAGDYMVAIRANGENVSDSSDFRVTVKTSTAWGIAGLGMIAASLLGFGAAVTRYGRR